MYYIIAKDDARGLYRVLDSADWGVEELSAATIYKALNGDQYGIVGALVRPTGITFPHSGATVMPSLTPDMDWFTIIEFSTQTTRVRDEWVTRLSRGVFCNSHGKRYDIDFDDMIQSANFIRFLATKAKNLRQFGISPFITAPNGRPGILLTNGVITRKPLVISPVDARIKNGQRY